ncbi:hypothetical protein IEQ34_021246 [Dendrobium chrysotoxum]|uniref:Uncharacterized protein n=1 Tax=Dendrobium chrysotoxum TaxID=161865 RepID=A0AAV7FLZ3_DENCH|nr:hypothetical protein IEQ34_021246 [Dendrobium chrysotoxum]
MCRCRILPRVWISAENPWSLDEPRLIASRRFTATCSPLGMLHLYTMPAPPLPMMFSSLRQSSTSSQVKSRCWKAVSFHTLASLTCFNDLALIMATMAKTIEQRRRTITRSSLKEKDEI